MLKDLEEAIKAQRDELRELKAMNNDAQIARDTAKSELGRLEQSVYESKREREAALAEYKRQAEEKKEHAEKVEKRVSCYDNFCNNHNALCSNFTENVMVMMLHRKYYLLSSTDCLQLQDTVKCTIQRSSSS